MTQRQRNAFRNAWSAALCVAAIGAYAHVATAQAQHELTDADRAEIQKLADRYLQTLNACAAEDYADLFVPGGYFESTFRGRVEGREGLMELVRSERHCQPGAAPRAGGATAPKMDLKATADGAIGEAALPNNLGGLVEHYVKTPQGWRYQSRIVYTAKELETHTGPSRGPQ